MTDATAGQLRPSAHDTLVTAADGTVWSCLLAATCVSAFIGWLTVHWHALAISICGLSIQWLVSNPEVGEMLDHMRAGQFRAPSGLIASLAKSFLELITGSLVAGFIAAGTVVGLFCFLTGGLEAVQLLLILGVYIALGGALRNAICSLWPRNAVDRPWHLLRSGIALLLGCMTWLLVPANATIHQVFQTRVTHRSANRPAVHVEVKDDTEFGGFGTAELYLSVQSSRFPSGVQVLLPLNREGFRGCQHRFVQLPFEVEEGDNLSFELIDDNQLTTEQEQTILLACKGSDFCVRLGNAILAPDFDWIVGPTSSLTSEAIASATVLAFQDSPFRNFGSGTFIVQSSKPMSPHAANPVELLDRSSFCRASVRVYYPRSPLSEH